MPKSSALSLTLPSLSNSVDNLSKALSSPKSVSPRSPRSPPPMSAPLHSPKLEQPANQANFADAYDPHSPITSLPPTQASPKSPKHKKGPSAIFTNRKANKSANRLGSVDSRTKQKSSIYISQQNTGSTPELSLVKDNASMISGVSSSQTESSEMRNTGSAASNHPSPPLENSATTKKSQKGHKLPLLGRSRSVRSKEDSVLGKIPPAHEESTSEPEGFAEKPNMNKSMPEPPMRTAPLKEDRSFRTMMNNSMRNRSADRLGGEGRERESSTERRGKGAHQSSSFKETGTFLSNFRDKALDGAGRAGRGIFNKLARSGSSHEKETPALDPHYENKIINLPLVEQTRKTRISKKLEDSRDKTEYWMPALPWRCIDYLNFKGCDQEGLYRVPGSQKDIKFWERRFDTDLDIDLFNEPDLHDINTIGSLFKNWLRDLPDEILPKSVQARIASQCQGATTTPQLLKDELSRLPPFNYYLLFAITCHISLLHSCAKENKMDYRNLCICFQPCMKIDAFCFQFLVLDWRNCWQGCWTEKEYLVKELEHEASPGDLPSRNMSVATGQHFDERTVSSSGSSKPSMTGSSTPERQRPTITVQGGRLTPENSSMTSRSNTTASSVTPSSGSQLRVLPELSPILPLSPINPVSQS